jgi:hypothetical protein
MVMSTVRGQLTNPAQAALWPSINNLGEVIYTAKVGGRRELFSTVRGQITFSDSFAEPERPSDCGAPLLLYDGGGVAGQTDINDLGEVVFSRWLLAGPYPDEQGSCFYWAMLQIVKAEPIGGGG